VELRVRLGLRLERDHHGAREAREQLAVQSPTFAPTSTAIGGKSNGQHRGCVKREAFVACDHVAHQSSTRITWWSWQSTKKPDVLP
jgi:hypothetical protein